MIVLEERIISNFPRRIMEHTRSHREIQGGGSGSGLIIPSQIRRHEPILERKIVQDSLRMAQECGNVVRNGEESRIGIWMGHLKDRFFTLSERRRIYDLNRVDKRFLNSHASINPRQIAETPMTGSEGSVSQLARIDVLSNEVTPVFHVRYIPGISRSLPEILKLWRFGSEQFKPVRMFEKASKRRMIVPNYTNASWVKGGQKSAYLRIRDICFFIHEFAPVACNVWEEGLDKHWNNAIENFHSETGSKFLEKSSSALLNFIRKSQK